MSTNQTHNCATCFNGFQPPTDEKKPAKMRCALRPPTSTKAGLPIAVPTARCTFWTDAKTLEQPYRHLHPGEPARHEQEGK